MPLPNSPSPLSYGPPQLSFDGLDQLGNNYYQGAEQRRKYDLARAFQGGIPRKPDGTPDIQAMTEVLARHGQVDLPQMQDQVDRGAAQSIPGPYSGGSPNAGLPAPTGAPVGPPAASPSKPITSFRDVAPTPTAPASRGAMPQPALSSAGTDNAGAQTLRGLATELAGGKEVGQLIPRWGAAFKVDPDAPLSPEQEAALKPVIGRSLAAMSGGAAPVPAPPPAAQSAAPQPASNPVIALPPGFNDPKQAIDALRKAADNLQRSTSPYAKDRAKTYLDEANKIEAQAFGTQPGFERVAGGVRPIPGGAEDPAYISAKTDAALRPMPVAPGVQLFDPRTNKLILQNDSGLLDKATIDAMARQAMSGDTSVFTNLGRGAQGAENVIAVRKRIAELNSGSGESGAEQANRNAEFFGVKAGQRTLGTRSANIELAATEFKQVLPVVQAASKAVSRTNYPDLNKIIQAFEEKTGDPNIVKFGGGVNTLVNLYARAISPSGTPTVSDKDHARLILNRAWSQGQFDAAVDMMSQEIDAALKSPDSVRDAMRKRFLEGQGGPKTGEQSGTTAAPTGTTQQQKPVAPSPADIEAEMRRRGLLK